MKQIYLLLSYVFDNYFKICKFLEFPSPSHYYEALVHILSCIKMDE
jgi:hypothetical protein